MTALLPTSLDLLQAPRTLGTDPNIVFRPAQPRDAAALRALYLAARAPEFLPLGLPAAMLASLLDGQFRAQQMGYAARFPDLATYVLVAAEPGDETLAGRLMLAPDGAGGAPMALRIVDILIAADWQGRGLGAAVLTRVAAAACAARFAELKLDVAVDNFRARRLYEKLGFVAEPPSTESPGPSIAMRRRLVSIAIPAKV